MRPIRAAVSTGTRSRRHLEPFAPVSVKVVSTNPNVMKIDSAFSVNAAGDTAVTVVDTNSQLCLCAGAIRKQRERPAGVFGPGFAPDSTPLST